MSVNIDAFKKFVEFCSNKNQAGNTITIPQFNLIADQAQMLVFEKDRAVFLETNETSDYLESFLKPITISVSPTGVVNYPSDWQHTAAVRSYYSSNEFTGEVTVDCVKNKDWGDIISSQLLKPTKRFPKYTEFKNSYRFAPKNIGIVMLDYFSRPVAPVWNYTIVNNEPVYSSSGSVDFEFELFSLNSVAAQYLSLIGINLQDSALQQFSEMFKKETNSVL